MAAQRPPDFNYLWDRKIVAAIPVRESITLEVVDEPAQSNDPFAGGRTEPEAPRPRPRTDLHDTGCVDRQLVAQQPLDVGSCYCVDDDTQTSTVTERPFGESEPVAPDCH